MLALGLLFAAAAASPAGLYVANQAEVGAAIELLADGNFRYQLDYGAVSESATGRWTSDGSSVFLTNAVMPVEPAYELVADEPLPKGKLALEVIEPKSDYFDRIDVVLEREGEVAQLIRVGRDEIISLPAGRVVAAMPLVPVIGTTGGRFALSAMRGHKLVLKFHPNDLGTARFDHEKLAIADGDLLLKRYDLTIRFERAKR